MNAANRTGFFLKEKAPWPIFLFILFVPFFVVAFIGFDPHHDGLILTTIRELKVVIQNGGPWPFNQYGPSWVLPFLVMSYLVPSNFLFFYIRFLVVVFYFLSAYILFRTAQKFLSKALAHLTIAIFLISQPFSAQLSSDLIPWPSAFAMLMTSAMFAFYVIKTQSENGRYQKLSTLCIGLVLPWIIASRIQVGGLLLVSAVLLVSRKSPRTELLWLTSGFFFSGFAITFFLFCKGWLYQAFTDQVIFGSVYVRGDTTTYPKPYWTVIGSFGFFMLFLFFPRLIRLVGEKRKKMIFVFVASFFVLILAIFLQKVLLRRGLVGVDQFVILSRRVWICLTLAALVFAFFNHLRDSIKNQKLRIDPSKEFLIQRALLLISIAAESQIYPLFDQMHFWWGSLPAVLVLSQILRSRIYLPLASLGIKRNFLLCVIVGIGVLSLFPLYSNLQEKRDAFPRSISHALFVYPSQARNERNLQHFFNSYLHRGERVLNLCSNSNVFFVADRYRSSTRLFVYWYPFELIPQYRKEYQSSRESAIITCTINQVAIFAKATEARKSAIVNEKFRHPELVASYVDSQGMEWKIFRDTKS